MTLRGAAVAEGEVQSGRAVAPPAEPQPHLQSVQQRTLRGVATMAGREIVIKLLAFGGWIVLARLLDPAVFGLFAIANFMINVFILFSEVGLGAALVRSRSEVPPRELDALFTLQLACVLGIAAVMTAVAPFFNSMYGVPGAGWVLVGLAGALVLVSLRTVPAVVSQRRLRYGPLVWADVSGQVVYWVSAVLAALAGLGVWSVVIALLSAGLVGTLVIYARVGWRPALQFDWRAAKRGALFSVAYQSQLAASFAKYMMFPLLGGFAYGPTAVGYVTWAHQLSVVPVQLAQLVSRVSYSAFSRLHGDREALTRLLHGTLRWTCKLSLPVLAVVTGLAPQIIEFIYSSKWLPALPALYLLLLSALLSSIGGVLLSALYSLGRGAEGLRIAIGWTTLTWVLGAGCWLAGLGFEGLAVAFLVATVAALVWTLYDVRDLGVLPLLGTLWLPIASAALLTFALYLLGPVLVHSISSLAVVAGAGGLVGLAVNLWGERSAALTAIRFLLPGRSAVAPARELES